MKIGDTNYVLQIFQYVKIFIFYQIFEFNIILNTLN